MAVGADRSEIIDGVDPAWSRRTRHRLKMVDDDEVRGLVAVHSCERHAAARTCEAVVRDASRSRCRIAFDPRERDFRSATFQELPGRITGR